MLRSRIVLVPRVHARVLLFDTLHVLCTIVSAQSLAQLPFIQWKILICGSACCRALMSLVEL